tara:strand:- start:216 stop:422 length:207 start_codon:yes stop_codon:yes gene_type:complete
MTININKTYAIIKKYIWSDGSNTVNIEGSKFYNDLNLANLIAKDFADREPNKETTYTVVAMPFDGGVK